MHKQSNTASFEDGFFIVQSCDGEEDNIGIHLDGADLTTYRHVELPSLRRSPRYYERARPGDALTDAEFDQIVTANCEKLLRLLAELNRKE